MSSFLPNSKMPRTFFLFIFPMLQKALKLYRMYTKCLEYTQAVVEQTGFLSSSIQVKLSSTSTQKRVKYAITKVFVIFPFYLIEMNLYKKRCTIINKLNRSYLFQIFVILGANQQLFTRLFLLFQEQISSFLQGY